MIVFIPGIILIVYSMISKRTIEPIILAVLSAYFIKYGLSFPNYFLEGLFHTLANETIIFLLIMLTLFGGLIELIKQSSGINKIAEFLKNRICTQRSALLTTWLLGLILFMDDYLNSLLVGTTMKNITDTHGIPREHLSMISITTSVPLSILTPVSTWAVFIFGILKTTSLDTSLGQVKTYIKVIPFAIYPMISLLGTGLLIAGLLPKVFKLKVAYQTFEQPAFHGKSSEEGHIMNFILPITILVIVTIATLDITFALMTSIVIYIIWLILSKQMSLPATVDNFLNGMSTMTSPLVFIIFAFTFGDILTDLGFSDTILHWINPIVTHNTLPFFSFVFVAVLVFFGIDVWAVVPLIVPILLPIASAYHVNPFLIVGTALSGISLGTSLCLVSESNILVSETIDSKPMNQVMTLLPYALFYGVITSLIYIYMGYRS